LIFRRPNLPSSFETRYVQCLIKSAYPPSSLFPLLQRECFLSTTSASSRRLCRLEMELHRPPPLKSSCVYFVRVRLHTGGFPHHPDCFYSLVPNPRRSAVSVRLDHLSPPPPILWFHLTIPLCVLTDFVAAPLDVPSVFNIEPKWNIDSKCFPPFVARTLFSGSDSPFSYPLDIPPSATGTLSAVLPGCTVCVRLFFLFFFL